MKTDDQLKDSERLVRYIKRHSLVSVMNNSKWEKLTALMLHENQRPLWRVCCLRVAEEYVSEWDGDWYYHLPKYKSIEWLEINPVISERTGHLMRDRVTDKTQYFVDLLKNNNVPFSIESQFLRVWGYLRPGHAVTFV